MGEFIEAELVQPTGVKMHDPNLPIFIDPPKEMQEQQGESEQPQSDEYFSKPNDFQNLLLSKSTLHLNVKPILPKSSQNCLQTSINALP